MVTTVLVSLVALVLATLVHYEALYLLSVQIGRWRTLHRLRVLVAVLGAFAAHAIEVGLYGIGIHVLVTVAGAGTLTPESEDGFWSAMYLAGQCYTSLGFGDLHVQGPVRLITVTATLNGLLLIAWSASFLYLEMERYWKPQVPAARHSKEKT